MAALGTVPGAVLGLGHGRLLGHHDRGAESHEAATEGDGARREPGPPEGQPGHHVGEPVDAEQHPAGGDRDSDRDGVLSTKRARL